MFRSVQVTRSAFSAIFAITALCGCAGSQVSASQVSPAVVPDDRPLATTLVYDCNGFEFIARLGPGEMAVWLPDRYLILSRDYREDNVLYQESDVTFRTANRESTLEVGAISHRDCTLMPQRVPWEDARRRSVDFRAVGDSPAWTLEIQNDRHLLFLVNPGMRRVVTPDPGSTYKDRVLTWVARTESVELTIEVTEEPCTDAVAQEVFPYSVSVSVDGDLFFGCGRELDHPWL